MARMVGFQVAELSPFAFMVVTTVCGLVDSWVDAVGVTVAEPVAAASAPMRYAPSPAGIVSAVVRAPVVKSVAVTVAVHSAAGRARASGTWTAPRLAVMVPPGPVAPRAAGAGRGVEGGARGARTGTGQGGVGGAGGGGVVGRGGVRTGTVVAQGGAVGAGGQLLPGVVEATVSARVLLPVSGVVTVNDPVTVAVCPGVRSPVQTALTVAGSKVSAPVVTTRSPL